MWSSAPIENKARSQAIRDTGRIEELAEGKKPVRIIWSKAKSRNVDLAMNAIDETYPGKEAPDEDTSKRLREDYQRAHRRSLEGQLEELCKEKEASINYFETEREARLRELAIADKEKFPNPQHRPYHQRDIGMIRVLMLLEINLSDVDDDYLDDYLDSHLANIHIWADKYYLTFRLRGSTRTSEEVP